MGQAECSVVWCPEGAEMGDFYFNPGEAVAPKGSLYYTIGDKNARR